MVSRQGASASAPHPTPPHPRFGCRASEGEGRVGSAVPLGAPPLSTPQGAKAASACGKGPGWLECRVQSIWESGPPPRAPSLLAAARGFQKPWLWKILGSKWGPISGLTVTSAVLLTDPVGKETACLPACLRLKHRALKVSRADSFGF